jgi:hypothetical protein
MPRRSDRMVILVTDNRCCSMCKHVLYEDFQLEGEVRLPEQDAPFWCPNCHRWWTFAELQMPKERPLLADTDYQI